MLIFRWYIAKLGTDAYRAVWGGYPGRKNEERVFYISCSIIYSLAHIKKRGSDSK